VLMAAHRIRVERGDYNIAEVHLADAIETLIDRTRPTLSADRTPRNPYRKRHRNEIASEGGTACLQ